MQEGNIIKIIPLTDISEFIIQEEAVTQEKLNIIHSYGFFLVGCFTQDNLVYNIFRREYDE